MVIALAIVAVFVVWRVYRRRQARLVTSQTLAYYERASWAQGWEGPTFTGRFKR